MQLRLVQPGDAEAIRAIYNHEVASGTNTFDLVTRSLEEQRTWIDRHCGAHPAVVAVDEEHPHEVLGFAVVSPFRDRAAYATTVEDSVYVHSDHRGRGVGRGLLEELLRLASAHGFHAVIARISSENEASVRLHRACGFEVVGVEREVGRKHGRWLDVVELQRML
ncbi:MAG: GNAT family N-acetyltransferase [Actinomycetota bacterium]|nr:GNAT family N-acetyltransferase [Actinomycetota bacterium]